MFKFLVFICLALIVFSLGAALIHLLYNRVRGEKTAKALTLRIALSIALFVALLLAARFGYIKPHGLREGLIPERTKTMPLIPQKQEIHPPK